MISALTNLGCRFACVVAACALIALGAPAGAQIERLPTDLITAAQLTSPQEQQIQEFVQSQFRRMASDDATQITDARRSLESPFIEREAPSIAFRLAYGTQVAIEVRRLLEADDTDTLINALLVAGKVGTPQTVELLGEVVEGRRGNGSPAVRAAAVAALHNVIREADAGRVRREQGAQAVTHVGRALANADNAAFASACVIALASTERNPLHPRAAQELATALPQLASSLRNMPQVEDPQRWEQAMYLGLRLIQMHILQAAGRLDRELAKASVDAGAEVLGFVVTRLRDLGPAAIAETEEQARLVGLTDQAEKLMQLAGSSVPGFRGGLGAKLSEAIESGDEDLFLDAALETFRWVQRVTEKSPDEYGF